MTGLERAARQQETRQGMVGWLGRHWRALLGGAIVLALVLVIWRHAHELGEAARLLRRAHPVWFVGALLVQALVYLCFATVYYRGLHLLGYHLRLLALYPVAFVAIFLGRAFPMGGTSTFAFLLYQLRRRGVPDGIGAVTVTLDGLSYLLAFLALLGAGFLYLFTHGELRLNEVLFVALVTLAILGLAMYVWGLSRDRALLTRRALALKDGMARLLRRSWGDTKVLTFIAELYEGGALISRNRFGFVQLVALHLVALLLDCLTLLLLFWTVGEWPHLSVVLLSYGLAYFVSTLSSLPGGGGTFEAAMTVTMVTLGVERPVALSVTLLYRLLAFWLPLGISVLVYRRVHYHNDTLSRRHEALDSTTTLR